MISHKGEKYEIKIHWLDGGRNDDDGRHGERKPVV